LAGCEEEDAALTFTVEHNSNPEAIQVEYYSPDPSCVPKYYYIVVDKQGGELELRCTNFQSIGIDAQQPQPNENCAYNFSVTGNLLRLHFDEIASGENREYSYDTVCIIATNNGKEYSTTLNIERLD
jgi:hypothetical protein